MAAHGGHGPRERRHPAEPQAPHPRVLPRRRPLRRGGRLRLPRGGAIPALRGAYVYSDLCDGVIRAMTINGRTQRNLGESRPVVVSFGQDNARELYVLTLSGRVWRIIPSS